MLNVFDFIGIKQSQVMQIFLRSAVRTYSLLRRLVVQFYKKYFIQTMMLVIVNSIIKYVENRNKYFKLTVC